MATMSQIFRKNQILTALVETRQKILAEALKLSDEQQDEVFLGIWSMRDLLAHLIGWDHTNLDAVKSILDRRVPAFYDHHDRDWKTYNAMLVRKYKKGTARDLLARAKDSQTKWIAFLQTVPPDNFNKDFGVRFRGYKVTVQRLLEAEVKDEETHLQQITSFFTGSK